MANQPCTHACRQNYKFNFLSGSHEMVTLELSYQCKTSEPRGYSRLRDIKIRPCGRRRYITVGSGYRTANKYFIRNLIMLVSGNVPLFFWKVTRLRSTRWRVRWNCVAQQTYISMMTSSNGNIFRVTGHLCGEFTGPRWIPHTKASDAELWCLLWSAPE